MTTALLINVMDELSSVGRQIHSSVGVGEAVADISFIIDGGLRTAVIVVHLMLVVRCRLKSGGDKKRYLCYIECGVGVFSRKCRAIEHMLRLKMIVVEQLVPVIIVVDQGQV